MFKCIYHAKGRHLYRFCLIAGKFLNKIYLHVFFSPTNKYLLCFFYNKYFDLWSYKWYKMFIPLFVSDEIGFFLNLSSVFKE